MNFVPPHRCIDWNEATHGGAYGDPHPLNDLAGERVELVVGPDQAALILEEGEVRGVLLEGHHLACVLHEGEEPGDLGENDYADRLNIDRVDVAAARQRLRVLQSHWRVVHVGLAPLAALGFGSGRAIAFDDVDHGPVEVEVEGAFRLKVVDPVRFYESFLRNTEDLQPLQFDHISGALVQGGIEHIVDETFESVDGIERDHRRLAETLTARLSPSLAHVGLALDQIEVTRLQTPVGLARAEAPADVPSLATAQPRQ